MEELGWPPRRTGSPPTCPSAAPGAGPGAGDPPRSHPFRERLGVRLDGGPVPLGRQGTRSPPTAGRAAPDRGAGDRPSPAAAPAGADPAPGPLAGSHRRPLRGYRLWSRSGRIVRIVVWLATQPHLSREVAIKAIAPAFANDPNFVRRFEAEAQTVARLEHPYIVPLYDYWREPDGAYLVMRYLRGGSAEGLLSKGPIDPEDAGRLVDQVAQALSTAHRQGVIHRDVKPSNVLLDEEGNAYLTDFGIARDPAYPSLAASGATATMPYVSPEVLRGEPAWPRATCTAWACCCTGRSPGGRPSTPPPPGRPTARFPRSWRRGPIFPIPWIGSWASPRRRPPRTGTRIPSSWPRRSARSSPAPRSAFRRSRPSRCATRTRAFVHSAKPTRSTSSAGSA